jgi:hypothetical protein
LRFLQFRSWPLRGLCWKRPEFCGFKEGTHRKLTEKLAHKAAIHQTKSTPWSLKNKR